MTRVVGLDPSLRSTGLAILTAPDGRTATIEALRTLGRPGHDSDGYSERSARIVAQTRRVVRAVPNEVDLIVIEGPSYGSQHGAAFDRAAVWHGIYAALRHRAPIAVVAPQTRAKWATGSGRADKAAVLAAVREQWSGHRIADDNQADSLTLANIGAFHLGWHLPFETKTRHTAALDKVNWPEGISS